MFQIEAEHLQTFTRDSQILPDVVINRFKQFYFILVKCLLVNTTKVRLSEEKSFHVIFAVDIISQLIHSFGIVPFGICKSFSHPPPPPFHRYCTSCPSRSKDSEPIKETAAKFLQCCHVNCQFNPRSTTTQDAAAGFPKRKSEKTKDTLLLSIASDLG